MAGLDEPVHPFSLTRGFSASTHKVGIKMKTQAKKIDL